MTDEMLKESESYLKKFNDEIDVLLLALTGYRSIILRLGIDPMKIKSVDQLANMKQIDEKHEGWLINLSDQVRGSVECCYARYQALKDTMSNLKSDTLQENYEKIITFFLPELDIVTNYTFEIHKCFVKSTINEIINKLDTTYEPTK